MIPFGDWAEIYDNIPAQPVYRGDPFATFCENLKRYMTLYGHCTKCEVVGDRREVYCWNCQEPYNTRKESRQ